MQHQLSMAKIDPFRVAGGPGGIEGCGASVFIKVRKIKVLRTHGQQVFVLSRKRNAGLRALPFIAEQNEGVRRFQAILDGVEDRQEIGVTEDDIGPSMIESVENLFR